MPTVYPKHGNEPFEVTLNRFKRAVDKANTMNDFYRHEFYEKPCTKRNRKRAAAVKRTQRQRKEDMANRPMV